MKYLTIMMFFLAVTTIFAQNKGINLINKKSNDTTFIKENKRIKIITIDRKCFAGKFTVLNDSTICIKDRNFSIETITKIKKASTFSGILRTISISVGTIFVAGGVGLATSNSSSAGNYGGLAQVLGVALFITGLPLVIVPLTENKHQVKKWKYEIVD